jgi:DNA-binding PadR family transcriptional regulator
MHTDILILAMLRERPHHGYEIKKAVDQSMAGMVSLNNKTLYLTLKRFEDAGAVTREVQPQPGKPPRHIYHLTERGVELLSAYLRDFGPDQARVDAEFFTRVSFFDFLEVPERREILQQRLTYLEVCLDYIRSLRQIAKEDEDYVRSIVLTPAHAQRVLAFQTDRIRDEITWIRNWLAEMPTEPDENRPPRQWQLQPENRQDQT